MGLFKDLFGGKPKPSFEHPRLGVMKAIRLDGERTMWSGTLEYDGPVPVYVHGNEQAPDENAVTQLERVVTDPSQIGLAKSAVLDALRNADTNFAQENFDREMKLTSISLTGAGELEITYEQRGEPYYLFNAHFKDGQPNGVSIDS